MPYFKSNKSVPIQERFFQFPPDIQLKHIAVNVCKKAQALLDCFGKFHVEEDEAGNISATFSHAGADQLFETVRDWCKTMINVDIDIDIDVADCIGTKIDKGHISCYQWVNDDDDEEIKTSAIIFGDAPAQFLQRFEQLAEKFSNDWEKKKTVIKTVNFAVASHLARLTEEKHQDDNTFIFALPPNDTDDEKANKYTGYFVIFGEDTNTYISTYNKMFNKYVFQDTPEVLALILMNKTPTQMDRREVIFVPNGLQTFIYPCSDDEEKNNRFYKELFRLRSSCIDVEVKTTLNDNNDLKTICREVKKDNVFYFIKNCKIFLHGLSEDVKPFRQDLEKRLREAEGIAAQSRARAH